MLKIQIIDFVLKMFKREIVFVDFPQQIELNKYEQLKNRLVKELIEDENILSVYQIGSVAHPGISDLDLVCVFRDGSKCSLNLREKLNKEEQKILTHGFFGVEESNFSDAFKYTLLSDLTLLAGLDLDKGKLNSTSEFNRQIAIEYMVKMLLTLDFQIHIGLVKLRAFLLLAKGIKFDLELLQIQSGDLYDNVQKVMKFRDCWFNFNFSDKEMTEFILEFRNSLAELVRLQIEKEPFYLPKSSNKINGVFEISPGEKLNIKYNGINIPKQLRFLGSKFIGLQFRTNRPIMILPHEVPDIGSIQYQRFCFNQKILAINKSNFPHFIPLSTSLTVD